MIYFFLVWIMMLTTSYAVGVSWEQNNPFPGVAMRLGDRIFLRIWLGLILLSIFFLTLALWLPLTLPLGIISCLLLSGIGFLTTSEARQELHKLKLLLQRSRWLSLILLIVAGCAITLTTQSVKWVESEFYHFQAVRWLSEYGVVNGIVLLMKNLGIVSSWFALVAPWNGNVIEFRAGAVANGLIILVSLFHLVLALYRIYFNRARSSDGFIASFYLFLLAYAVISDEFKLIMVSLSPDLPVIFLIGIVSWSLFVISESKNRESADLFPIEIVPLVLAIGAVAVKLSALPILATVILYYAWNYRYNLRFLIIGATTTLVLLLPVMVVGYKTSGCIFYPASSFCFDVPWSLPLTETQEFGAETTSLKQWFGSPPSDQIAIIWLFQRWYDSRPLNRLMVYLTVLSIGCGVITLKFNQFKLSKSHFWVIFLAIFGIIFIFLQGPLIRFALGYLLLIPAVTVSTFIQPLTNSLKAIQRQFSINISSHRLLFLTAGLFIAIAFSYPNLYRQWLIPPPPPETVLAVKEGKDFIYYVPIADACWATKLPCNSNNSSWAKIQLKDSKLGIKGGFSRY